MKQSLDARGSGLSLIGLRGAGKTTLGRQAAELARRPFLDLDQWIELHAGKTITEIFATEGEASFRRWEERVLEELVGSNPGAVISTGGGVVKSESNRDRFADTASSFGSRPAFRPWPRG